MRINRLWQLATRVGYVCFAFCISGPTALADYLFIRIADTSDNQNLNSASINNSRQAAFRGQNSQGLQYIGRWDYSLGSTTNIFTATNQPNGSGDRESLGSRPAINNLGHVAFKQTLNPQLGGVTELLKVSANDVIQTYVTDTSSGTLQDPFLSDGGRIVYAFSNSVITRESSGSSQSFGTGRLLGINASGTIAFGQGRSIQVGSTPADLQEIPLTTTMGLQPAGAVSETGTVAFVANDNSLPNSGYNVYTGVPGAPPTIIAGADQFDSLTSSRVSINGHNDVLFVGAVGEVLGLYSTSFGLDSPIIRVGDALDGSTVTGLSVSGDALNDWSDISFTALLADGRTGIYFGRLTAVPEPSALVLSLAVLIPGVFSRRRIAD